MISKLSPIAKLILFLLLGSILYNYYYFRPLPKYDIVFETNGGTPCPNISTFGFEQINLSCTPIKQNYKFDGWFEDNNTWNRKFTSSSLVLKPLFKTMVVYAKWVKKYSVVTFDPNGGEVVYGSSVQNVLNGNSANPPIVSRVGYTFIGWDKPYTNIIQDTIIKASWRINNYTLSFETNGGNKIGSVTYEYNATLSRPNDPIKEGYYFVDWYTEQSLTNKFLFDRMPNKNLTIYAKWEVVKTYNYNGTDYEKVIAHSLGGLDGNQYLNCYECFEYYYNKGTKYFEIDLLFSTDKKLIASHSFENIGGSNMTYLQYKNYKIEGKYRGVTEEDLKTMLSNYKDVFFVIDTKEANKVELIRYLVNYLKNNGGEHLLKRVIPYVYKIADYNLIESIYSFDEYIFTPYQNYLSFLAEDSESEIIQFISSHDKVKSVVVNYYMQSITGYDKEFFDQIISAKKELYLFTIDGMTEARESFNYFKATGIVTNTVTIDVLKNWLN